MRKDQQRRNCAREGRLRVLWHGSTVILSPVWSILLRICHYHSRRIGCGALNSVQSRVRECGSQNSSHYKLKRLSQGLSQISSNDLRWYGKASESYEVHVKTVPNPGRLQRRLSQIITPSNFWRDDDSPLEEFKAFGGETDGDEIENPAKVSHETRHGHFLRQFSEQGIS
ncbi:uncharacterized protein PGTG_08067 [Puccinia graminis f. sp. tritici CRL 75-36-700-3]|uniref:Uncharacterized protein n=1 Tax=Puccinia graminis f. sp. tritici (strain CRL 75-36-700-3 / race SCCL) TaxID=418459 RepID=E3KC36_PUCGT|nr:uncharacterized protein PGTG_08067 [Puccinia graminis f. sp. tritici CRL 75-36-700-3]EFP81818.2 hypothetical protein PGTG_08067 [Puccinia graminis f. sp. tritici CRL 75-36-700-3]